MYNLRRIFILSILLSACTLQLPITETPTSTKVSATSTTDLPTSTPTSTGSPTATPEPTTVVTPTEVVYTTENLFTNPGFEERSYYQEACTLPPEPVE